MLRKLSLALAVSCASNGMAWAAEAPLSTKTDLVSVYQEAVDNNADLAAARAQYGAQKEVVPQARAGLLPNLSGGAEVANVRTAIDQPSATANRNAHSYQATLAQPLFRADRWFQYQAAKDVNEQAALQLSATEQNLILQTAESYFNVLRSQDNLASTKAEEAAFKRQLDQSNERFDVGLSDKTDVLQSQASYDTARANRIVAQRQVDDAFEALDHPDQPSVQLDPGHRPHPADPAAGAERRQGLGRNGGQAEPQSAGQQLRRQRRRGNPQAAQGRPCADPRCRGANTRKVTTMPWVSATRTPSASRTVATSSRRTVGLQLNIPIYSGGLTNSQVRQSYAQLDQTEQQRESLRRQIVENTRNLHRAVNTDVEQVQARKQSIISNQSAVEATEIGYQVGTRNIVDVLDAQRSALHLGAQLQQHPLRLHPRQPALEAGGRHVEPGGLAGSGALSEGRLQPGQGLPAAGSGQGCG